jgi:hypothetical protein
MSNYSCRRPKCRQNIIYPTLPDSPPQGQGDPRRCYVIANIRFCFVRFKVDYFAMSTIWFSTFCHLSFFWLSFCCSSLCHFVIRHFVIQHFVIQHFVIQHFVSRQKIAAPIFDVDLLASKTSFRSFADQSWNPTLGLITARRVARLFLVQHTKTEKITIKYTKWTQNRPMAIK